MTQYMPRSLTLDKTHDVIRALGLQSRSGGPPQGDTDSHSDLEVVPTTPANGAPATPPAGGIQALCPAWKRGHCTGEGWCPRQLPRPAADNRVLPAVGYTASCAALRYGVAQGWIQDEATRGSVNIKEAVDWVAHTGQTEVPRHPGGATADPQRGSSWSPRGWC